MRLSSSHTAHTQVIHRDINIAVNSIHFYGERVLVRALSRLLKNIIDVKLNDSFFARAHKLF